MIVYDEIVLICKMIELVINELNLIIYIVIG